MSRTRSSSCYKPTREDVFKLMKEMCNNLDRCNANLDRCNASMDRMLSQTPPKEYNSFDEMLDKIQVKVASPSVPQPRPNCASKVEKESDEMIAPKNENESKLPSFDCVNLIDPLIPLCLRPLPLKERAISIVGKQVDDVMEQSRVSNVELEEKKKSATFMTDEEDLELLAFKTPPHVKEKLEQDSRSNPLKERGNDAGASKLAPRPSHQPRVIFRAHDGRLAARPPDGALGHMKTAPLPSLTIDALRPLPWPSFDDADGLLLLMVSWSTPWPPWPPLPYTSVAGQR